MIDPPETIEIKEGKGTTTFFCQDMRSVLKGTGSDDKVIFCGQNNAIGGISGVENIYLRNNSHDLQVFGASEFLIFTMKRIISKTIHRMKMLFYTHCKQ